MLLYGKNSIFEQLKNNQESIKKVYIQKDNFIPEILSYVKSKNISFVLLSKKEFNRISKGIHSQGIIAEINNYTYHDFDDLLKSWKEKNFTLLMLDSITDPQNFGSIMRTCACLGEFAIVLPKNRSVEITESVLRVAEGGENYVPVSKVTNLSQAIITAKQIGFFVVGTTVENGKNLFDIKFSFPMCLVIGSESKGIRKGLLKHLDTKITIPMKGANISFNVAIATSIFCYEITRQKTKLSS